LTIQRSLGKAVDDFYKLVDSGESRHQAAVKVASGNSLLPDQINRFCQTVNRAAVNTTRLGNSDLVDRLSSPGVLNPESVREGVFGRKTAGYSSTMQQLSTVLTGMEEAERQQLATIEKTAAAPVVDDETFTPVDGGIHGLYAKLSPMEVETTKLAFIKDINTRRHNALVSEQRAQITLSSTESWLRKQRDKDGLIKQAAYYARSHETELVPIIQYMSHKLGIDIDSKTAAAPTKWHKQLLGDKGVVDNLRLCVEMVKEASASLLDNFPKIVESKMRLSLLINTAAGNVPKTAMCPDGTYAARQEGEIRKVANMAGSFMGSMLGSPAAPPPKPGLQQDPGVQNFVLQLRNPQHEATLRSIRARSSLQDLLAGDEVLQAYEPGKVVDAFNELSQHTPSATENKALLRATLRQIMQNNVSVYDLQQFRGLERKGS